MKRRNALTIGEIVQNYLREEHLDTQLDEYRACSLWPQVVGDAINRYTVSRTVNNGIMRVRLSSAALRAELLMLRSTIVARLNEALGRDVIKEIIFS